MQMELKSTEAKVDTRLEYLDEQAKRMEKDREQLLAEIRELKEQNRAKWGNSGLEDFPDMPTLLRFLADDRTNELEYHLDDVQHDEDAWVCADYSFLLMRRAADRGYRLYPVVIFSMQGNRVVGAHMINFALVERFVPGVGIDEWIVAIEPMTDETTIIGRVYDNTTWIEKWYKFLP